MSHLPSLKIIIKTFPTSLLSLLYSFRFASWWGRWPWHDQWKNIHHILGDYFSHLDTFISHYLFKNTMSGFEHVALTNRPGPLFTSSQFACISCKNFGLKIWKVFPEKLKIGKSFRFRLLDFGQLFFDPISVKRAKTELLITWINQVQRSSRVSFANTHLYLAGSSGLVVMGGERWSRGREFQSRHYILDASFFTFCPFTTIHSLICFAHSLTSFLKNKFKIFKNVCYIHFLLL